MRRRAFLSGDWRAAGRDPPPRRTLCGWRGWDRGCQLVQGFEPEASSGSLPRPAHPAAGEGGLGQPRAWPWAPRTAAAAPPRAQRAGRAGRGPGSGAREEHPRAWAFGGRARPGSLQNPCATSFSSARLGAPGFLWARAACGPRRGHPAAFSPLRQSRELLSPTPRPVMGLREGRWVRWDLARLDLPTAALPRAQTAGWGEVGVGGAEAGRAASERQSRGWRHPSRR